MAEHDECLCMDMGAATTDCVPCAVGEDLWTQVARHGPGQGKSPMGITNRSIIYRLHPPTGEPFLALLNGLWVDEASDQPFKGLRALEESTGAPLRFILAPGASHHLSLLQYAKAFPEARVCVADGRIPRVNTELMAAPNVEAYPPNQPPKELGEAGLRVHVVSGLMEGPLTKWLAKVTAFDFSHVPNSTEPLMVLHEPSGTVTSGGHQWWYVPPDETNVFAMPGFMRVMLKWVLGLDHGYMTPGKISMEANGAFAIHDREAFTRSCAEILSWDFDRLLDVHAQPNKNVDTGAKALFTELLEPVVNGDWSAVPYPAGTLP